MPKMRRMAANVVKAQAGKGARCGKCGKPAPVLVGKGEWCLKCWNKAHLTPRTGKIVPAKVSKKAPR